MLTNLVHPTDAGVGTLDPLVFQLGFSRLLPHHLCWNPIFCCLPPASTLLFVNEGMGVASHDPQHRQSQMLPSRIPRWPGRFPTVPWCTRARSMLLCRLRSSLQAQPSLDAPLYPLDGSRSQESGFCPKKKTVHTRQLYSLGPLSSNGHRSRRHHS